MTTPTTYAVQDWTTRVESKRPAEVANALVQQKNEILEQLGNCDDEDDYAALLDKLGFVSGLWAALGYGYKVREIAQRTLERLAVSLEEALETQATCRRNTSQWKLWQAAIGKYRLAMETARRLVTE